MSDMPEAESRVESRIESNSDPGGEPLLNVRSPKSPPSQERGGTSASSSIVWKKRKLQNDVHQVDGHQDAVGPIDRDGNGRTDVPTSTMAAVPAPLVETLKNRGLTDEKAIHEWFRPTLKSLKDPFLLKDMDRAVERLVQARERDETILLYADYDLDGTSGLALALKALRAFGFKKVLSHQPRRLVEGYGLHVESIERLHKETPFTLMISIDLGVTGMKEVEFAKSLGIDVIITDHHLPEKNNGVVVLPDAFAVVNPNRGDCESGLGHLCGTGVIFYVMLALRRELQISDFDPKDLLDCFSIGTITDLVPLIEENRVLVKHGLMKLAQTERPGLQALLQELGLSGRPLNAQDVAIRYAPKLNALSRMGSGIQPIDLYLVEDPNSARELVVRVLSNNQDRQASQKSADDEAVRLLSLPPYNGEPKGAIVLASELFHRGVVGLVATKLSQRFGLPTFIGAIEESSVVGSARLPNGWKANLLEAMNAAGALDQFGGHAMAAGFETTREKLSALRDGLTSYFLDLALRSSADETLVGASGAKSAINAMVHEYDANCQFDDLNASFMTWYEHMGPFGSQVPIPIFQFENCTITQVKELKGGHLRLKLSQAGRSISAVWFSPDRKRLENMDLAPGGTLSVLAEVQWNHYQGSKDIQLLILDVCEPSRVVIAT